jgi:hypothetical protein
LEVSERAMELIGMFSKIKMRAEVWLDPSQWPSACGAVIWRIKNSPRKFVLSKLASARLASTHKTALMQRTMFQWVELKPYAVVTATNTNRANAQLIVKQNFRQIAKAFGDCRFIGRRQFPTGLARIFDFVNPFVTYESVISPMPCIPFAQSRHLAGIKCISPAKAPKHRKRRFIWDRAKIKP